MGKAGPTLHDVAARARVSTATVSRTLSGAAAVREPTRERVLAAVRALRYRPNPSARNLVTGAGGILGMVVPDLRRPPYAELAGAAARRARAQGYGLVIADWPSGGHDERAVVEDLARRAKGVVLCSPSLRSDEAAALADAAPLVVTGARLGAIPAVRGNERAAVDQPARYLHDLGHRRIGFVSAPSDPTDLRERQAAIDALEDVHAVRMTASGATFTDGRAIAGAAVSAGVSAVVAFDGELGLGLLAGLAERGIDVPGRMSVVATGDHPATRMTHPSLTTITPPTAEMGAAAIDLLLLAAGDAAASPALRTVRFAPRLEIRASTGPAPTRRGRR